MNAVVILRLNGQASLSAHLHIAFNVKRTRMNALKTRIDRLAKIINKVRRVLLRRQREFVAARDHDGRFAVALNKRAFKHEFELKLTRIDNDMTAKIALYRIDRIGCQPRKSQNSIFERICIRRTLGADDLKGRFDIFLDVFKADVGDLCGLADNRIFRRRNCTGSARGKHQKRCQ